ncbi:MAG: PAS domain S-box protein [Myxococcales bacterium]|nr:PAS domain S-box protein [Myxococcales bacterium]
MGAPDNASLAARIVERTTLGVWVIDANDLTSYANEALAKMLGATREELLGRSLYDWMDDEGRRIAMSNVERRKQGIAESHDFVFRRKDGSALWASVVTDPILDEAGRYVGAVAFITDVTQQRHRDTEREQLWRMLDESLNEVYLFRESDLRFEYVNRGALMNLGFTLDEARALTAVDLKPSFTTATFLAQVAPLVDGRETRLVFQTEHRRKDGSRYPVEVHLQRVMNGTESHFLAVIIDITERKRAAQQLAASEARFRTLINQSLDLILLGNGEGLFTWASPSVTRVLGYTPEEFVAKHPLEHIHPDDRTLALATLARTPEPQPVTSAPTEFRVRHRDGTWRVLSALGRNLLNDPAVRAMVMTARDVTAERALEEQLGQSRRLESVGRLAGGVAHDFNNILTTIITCAEFLESAGLSEAALADVREIKEAGDRAAELTSQLLAFARRRFIRPQAVDLVRLVTDRRRFLTRVLGEQVELGTHLPTDLWPVHADPTQLEQVILNLAVNARDAMPSGGKLTIEAANVTLDETFSTTHSEVKPGAYVRLAVSDTGVGIAADVLPHVFEPFFTTKGVGEGTGLGLATVYGIVKQSGGHIWVYSEPGIGTTFKIYLPKSDVDAVPADAQRSAPMVMGTERVLVVEDEEAVRRVVVRGLEAAGYTVHAVPGPLQALEWARANRGAFELLLTDVVMPGMSGKELAAALVAEFPHVKVLFASGYTENAIVHRGVLDEGVELLAKPFSPTDLRARVRALLDRR